MPGRAGPAERGAQVGGAQRAARDELRAPRRRSRARRPGGSPRRPGRTRRPGPGDHRRRSARPATSASTVRACSSKPSAREALVSTRTRSESISSGIASTAGRHAHDRRGRRSGPRRARPGAPAGTVKSSTGAIFTFVLLGHAARRRRRRARESSPTVGRPRSGNRYGSRVGDQLLRVGQDELLAPARRDREHPRAELVARRLLEQRRVLAPVQELLVGAPRGLQLDHLALLPAPVDLHGEAADRGVGRQGHAELPLDAPGPPGSRTPG